MPYIEVDGEISRRGFALMINAIFSTVRIAMGEIGKMLMAFSFSIVPRKMLERKVTGLLESYYPGFFDTILYFKSGRSALTALFQSLATKQVAMVLLPDYACNVIFLSAMRADIGYESYELALVLDRMG